MVGFRALLLMALLVGFGMPGRSGAQPGDGVDHGPFDQLLRANVSRDGRVNYGKFRGSAPFAAYLRQLSAASPGTISNRQAQLAFWINAYNAYTIDLIVRHPTVRSIQDVPTAGAKSPWDIPFIRIGGQTYTLNGIEHEVIRKRFTEPRIHFALVCAAKSCPKLRNEAYDGTKLARQLDEQTRSFLTNRTYNRVDGAAGKLTLSPLFNWYAEDFVRAAGSVQKFVAPYLPAEVRPRLLRDAFSVEFAPYDWRLNN